MADTFKIATLAQGVAGLRNLRELFSDGGDPFPAPFQNYTEIVGNDLAGAPIKAGLPTCTWHWDWLYRDDYAILAAYEGNGYIRTRLPNDAWAIYQAKLTIPQEPAPMNDGTLGPIDLKFVMMELQIIAQG